jgi:hypothetical protein
MISTDQKREGKMNLPLSKASVLTARLVAGSATRASSATIPSAFAATKSLTSAPSSLGKLLRGQDLSSFKFLLNRRVPHLILKAS